MKSNEGLTSGIRPPRAQGGDTGSRWLPGLRRGALAVVVLLGTASGWVILDRAFRGVPTAAQAPGIVPEGLIVVSLEAGVKSGPHLFTMNPDGSQRVQFTFGDVADEQPAASPDGQHVAFIRTTRADEAGGDIYTVGIAAEAAPARALTAGQSAHAPEWSPDGSRIVFYTSGDESPGIYVIDADGSNLRLVVPADGQFVADPTWSPDGNRIAFAATGSDQDDFWDLYSVTLDGSGLQNLTRSPSESELAPSWSWVADRIAFERRTEQGSSAVFTMASDGTDVKQVTSGDADRGPTWSPDGALILFIRDYFSLYVLPSNGAETEALLTSTDPTATPPQIAWLAAKRTEFGSTVVPLG